MWGHSHSSYMAVQGCGGLPQHIGQGSRPRVWAREWGAFLREG